MAALVARAARTRLDVEPDDTMQTRHATLYVPGDSGVGRHSNPDV